MNRSPTRSPVFTGIVEEVGRITGIEQRGENRRITIMAKHTPKELGTGHSVAVSGVCLTALDLKPNSFCADLAPETWARTSFSRMREGQWSMTVSALPVEARARMRMRTRYVRTLECVLASCRRF